MDLVLRAYDQARIVWAERLPIERLHTLLESGGIRERAKNRPGLVAEEDPWARETVSERLESLIQEGHGADSLARLRGATPPELALLRRRHWPPIDEAEAVALREDLVRNLTYGLWQAPETGLAHALAVLTGQPDASFLLGDPLATAGLRDVLDAIDDDVRFAECFGTAVHASLAAAGRRPDDAAVRRQLAAYGQLLGPPARLLRAAPLSELRVTAYQDDATGEGLTRFLAVDLPREDLAAKELPRPEDLFPSNGIH